MRTKINMLLYTIQTIHVQINVHDIILNSSIYSTVDYQQFRSDENLTILV